MKKIYVVHTQEQQVSPEHIHYSQLDVVSDASCDEINIGGTLDYIPGPHRIAVLQKILSKLRYEGSVEIEGADILAISRGIYYGNLVSDNICALLYNGKNSIDSVSNLVLLLEQRGLPVTVRQHDGFLYYIKHKRKE